MPIAVAAPVLVLMPTSWSASPRLRVMFSPGRASEPTARIQIRSGLNVDALARAGTPPAPRRWGPRRSPAPPGR